MELPVEASADSRWLRGGIAFVWLATGFGVLHPYYRELGLEFLAPTGLPPWVMWATCAGEIALGLRVLLGSATTGIVGLQMTLILGFTAILTVTQPELWLSSLGVLTKNLVLLGLLVTVWLLDREGWTPRTRTWLRLTLALYWAADSVSWIRVGALLPIGGELTLAVATVVLRGRALRMLMLLEMAVIVALLGLATWREPLLWVHPFGPLTKLVPVLVAAWRLGRLQ
jgi:hypothetical protein